MKMDEWAVVDDATNSYGVAWDCNEKDVQAKYQELRGGSDGRYRLIKRAFEVTVEHPRSGVVW